MSGFIRGKIECLVTNKNLNYNMQNLFKNLYDFFTSHPNYTLIALNYGSSGGPASAGAGTGANYVDSSNAASAGGATFGNNAFFVVRANPTPVRSFDVFYLFQWTGALNGTAGASFGSAPGNPGTENGGTNFGSNNNAGLCVQAAIGISGSGGTVPGNIFGASTSGSLGAGFGNPWRGSMNAFTGTLGIDQKANGGTNGLVGVWGAPPASGSYGAGTGVMIFPRSNNSNGTFAWGSTGGHFAENCAGIHEGNGNVSSNDIRMHIIADDDSWVFWSDSNDTNNSSTEMSYAGLYIPRNGLPSGSQALITPFCMIASINALPWAVSNQSIYGDAAGSSTNQQGGIIGNTTASVKPLVMDQSTEFMVDISFNPNNALSSSIGGAGGTGGGGGAFYDEYQIPVGIFESSPTQISGFLGVVDFVRSMFNVQTPGIRWDFNRTVVGSQTMNDRKYSIPWDSQNRTVPRSGTARQGITFIRPPPA